jgi:hypothetical protein
VTLAAYPIAAEARWGCMRDPRYSDLDCLEVINQDDATREVILRLAGLARGGRLDSFVAVVAADPKLDEDTRTWALELASDETFLFVVEDYLARCRTLH